MVRFLFDAVHQMIYKGGLLNEGDTWSWLESQSVWLSNQSVSVGGDEYSGGKSVYSFLDCLFPKMKGGM